MKWLYFILYIFVTQNAHSEKAVSKVSLASPVFVACDMDKKDPVIKEGVWFKFDKGQLFLAQKSKNNQLSLTKIEGDCTLEPNFIRK